MTRFIRSTNAFVFGVVLFAGLPLVGWGVGDFAGFTAHPARAAYLVVVAALQLYFAFRYPDLGRHSGVGRAVVARQSRVVIWMQLLVVAIILAAPWSDRHGVAALGGGDILRIIGCGVFALGFVVMNLAEVALGRLFSVHVTIQEGHRLVTEGVFRRIRHPRYSSILLYNIGLALVFQSWLALVPTAGLLLVMLWRIHDEEALLAQTFGTEWEEYVKRSWRLMVGVW